MGIERILWTLTKEQFRIRINSDMVTVPATDRRFPLIEAAVYSRQYDLLEGIVQGSITKVQLPRQERTRGNIRAPVTPSEARTVVEIKTPTKPDQDTREALWDKLDQLDREGLMQQPLSNLRPYARFRHNIVGASKIRGGKPVLVERIMEAREA